MKASRTKSLSLSDDFPMRAPAKKNLLTTAPVSVTKKVEDTGKILKYIDDSIIGKGVAFLGPYGRRKVTYADYSSSGRSLQFFEDYINKEVLPAFGDMSCTSSITGLQSQMYRNEARDMIRSAVRASDDDHIIFCEGTYSSLTDRLCYFLCYQSEHSYSEKYELRQKGPVLFVSTSEPAKNLVSWKNAGAQIIRITKTREGFLDLVDLEKKLSTYADSKRLLIGLFAGASRLTGILADDVATTILLHQYGALSIWDYSPAAPYAAIDMNPPLPGAPKDILFFNCRKFIGGVQGPGVIVIKKSLIVSINSSVELNDTVGVVESIRGGLVIQLKESLGAQNIAARQEKLCRQILTHVRTIPEIVLLGPSQTTAKRVPNLCFLVKHPRGSFLHHRFVVAVLNDVFGIQVTAGNDIGDSLGINKKIAADYETLLRDDHSRYEFLRPGYTKLLLPFFMSEAEVGFILEALKMVATEAWKLLPQYEIDENTGEWRHHSNSLAKERKCLGAIRYTDGRMLFTDRRISGPGMFPQSYPDCLQTARHLFNRARKTAQKTALPHLESKLDNNAAENLRWFMLPGEAHELLRGHSQNVKNLVPFIPNKSKELPSLTNMFRHNSLSALDVKLFKSRSLPTSPVQIPMRRQQSTPTATPPNSPQAGSLTEFVSQPTVRFTLGGEVTTMPTFSPPSISNLVSNEEGVSSRNSTCSDCTEELQAYVAEVTKELATEIKSEIRGVISKVEDVLEGNDAVDVSTINISLTNLNNSDDSRSDSVSASDVAEYLKGFSKEMASEVKSEIREAVNAMSDEHYNMPRKSSPPEQVQEREMYRQAKQRLSDIVENQKRNCNDQHKQPRSESFPRPNSTPGWHHPTASSPENSTPNCPYTGAISKLQDPNSTASQDSGINMCFQDQDDTRSRTLSENLSDRIKISSKRSQSDSSQTDPIVHNEGTVLNHRNCDCITQNGNIRSRTSSSICEDHSQNIRISSTNGRRLPSESEPERDLNSWQHLPKDVWKQTAEAIDEFDMLKDGDRILVCLSGSSASLCLLHALRQFSRARGIHIEMAAITVGKCGVDPRALMLYMRDISMDLFIEQLNPSESYRTKICALARRKNYNVLAMGNTLDKLADDFLISVLQKGRMHTPQAHCTNREGDLRIIRPFIYVRERFLEEFAQQKDMPTRPSTTFAKPLDASNSILKVQEVINPNVYENIKNALRPFLSLRLEANNTCYEYLKLSLISRD